MGVVNLLPVDVINEHAGVRLPGASCLCGGGKARDVLPGVESLPQLLTVLGGGQSVTPWAEVLGDGTMRREKALGVSWGLEPLHAPFPLPGGLMGVFGPIVQIAVLAVFHARQYFPLGRTIAFELVRDEHARHKLAALEQLPEEFLGRLSPGLGRRRRS